MQFNNKAKMTDNEKLETVSAYMYVTYDPVSTTSTSASQLGFIVQRACTLYQIRYQYFERANPKFNS